MGEELGFLRGSIANLNWKLQRAYYKGNLESLALAKVVNFSLASLQHKSIFMSELIMLNKTQISLELNMEA